MHSIVIYNYHLSHLGGVSLKDTRHDILNYYNFLVSDSPTKIDLYVNGLKRLAKKAEKEAKKAAEKTEKKVAKESKKDTHVTAKKGELGYMLPQKEEQEERVELHSEEEEEEEEDDYGIKHSFALNGKCYGVDEENTVYEMDGKQPVEIVGTWDTTTSYPIFNETD